MTKDENNPTTEQLMEAALRTVKQMSPEEKAKLRVMLDVSVKKMRRALSRTRDGKKWIQ